MDATDHERRLRSAGPDGYVWPDYEGYCFHRVVPTLLDLLGGDVPGDGTLPADAVADVEGIDRVLLLFVDGFGREAWRRHDHPLLSAFERAGQTTTLTSIYPSETAAAVTSHHTGLTAAEHGAIGWDQWLPGFNQVVQTLPFDPAAATGPDVPTSADLFDGDPLYPAAGVDATLVQAGSSVDSAYTLRATAGMDRRGYRGLDEFATTVGDAVAAGDGPALVDAYLPHVDAVAHASGTASADFDAEVDRVLGAVESALDGLPAATAERTLVALTADHGLLDTTPDDSVDLRELDGVWDHLATSDGERIPPVGSARNVHLFLAAGSVESVRTAIERQVECLTFTREEALAAGLFGPQAGERIRERCGDLVVVPREGGLWHEPDKLAFVGMHGGLSPAEMLVPLATARASDLR